jgi:SAM-dependent methyltransferase
LTILTDQNRQWFHEKTANWEKFWTRLGYSEVPDLDGKRILDVGSGLGSNTYSCAMAGALVTSLEPDIGSHERSRQLIQEIAPSLIGSITFVNQSIEDYGDPEKFDYIICDEVFEHLLNFRTAIDKMAALLTPGGRLCSGWGPLWNSPTGGHQLTMSLAFSRGIPRFTTKPNSFSGTRIRIPYSHRLFAKLARNIYASDRNLSPANSCRELGMNGLPRSEYINILQSSDLVTDKWQENAGLHPVYKILRALASIPGLRESSTSSVFAVFRRA